MSTLRVTAGTLRGRRIEVPQGDVRPTSEKARQAYFDIAGPRIAGARFLDLFAGSGIFSFEAVSRGAREAVAVDSSRRHTAAIALKAAELHLPITTVTADVLTGIKRLEGGGFQLLYADPPYAWTGYRELLEAIGELSLAEDALIAIEHRRRTDPFGDVEEQGPLRKWKRVEYGEVWITMFTSG